MDFDEFLEAIIAIFILSVLATSVLPTIANDLSTTYQLLIKGAVVVAIIALIAEIAKGVSI